jgi:aspartyl/asparaginyl beta-hydroxylase (cupin superfamily)
MLDGKWMSNEFPVTSQAIHNAKVPATEILFAILPRRHSLPWHTDSNNYYLTCHLAIEVPCSGENMCRLKVGDTEKQWINGEMLLFDQSIYHRAVNDADKMRVVLVIVAWHPDLSEVERQALRFIFDVCYQKERELVSSDKEQRRNAEERVAASRAFPQICTAPKKLYRFLARLLPDGWFDN